MKRVFVVGALAACNSSGVSVAPVVDVPVNDTASGFPVDSITLSAAHNGSLIDIASATFTKGQAVDLAGIPFGDDLVIHMVGRVGTGEFSYGRTCAFTFTQNATPPEPHLYFSRTAKFGALGFTPLLRYAGAAVPYHDGSGILVGGVSSASDPTSAVTDVERFDPTMNDYRPLTSISARLGGVIALLGTGTETLVMVIGGTDPTGAPLTFVETIEAENPADRRVERIDDTTMARVGLSATTLTDGTVVVIGGSGAGSGSGCGPANDPSACVETIGLANGTPTTRPAHGTLLHGRWNHTATRLSNDAGAPVLVAGGIGTGNGSGSAHPIAEAELYNPVTDQFASSFNYSMVIPRSQHQAVRLLDGSVVIIGGVDAGGQPVRQLEVFTPYAGFSAPTGVVLPATSGVVGFTATSLPDGRVLLTGGSSAPGGPPVDTAVILQPNTDTGGIDILPTDHLTVARTGHSATLLCDGTVLISGGTTIPTGPQPAERYNPSSAGRR